jgi:2-isopropylmalate synthase
VGRSPPQALLKDSWLMSLDPRPSAATDRIEIYDTTLRDGAQQVGLDFTVADKLAVAQRMDELGVDVVEGGWPGSNPKDVEFFARARDLPWRTAVLSAFGATRRPRKGVDDDPNLAALIESGAPVVALVGKSSPLHVTEALRTTYDENLAMVRDSVAYMVAGGRRVAFDAEHFFDGWALDPAYALAVAEAAADAGADTIVLCDTNGGTMPLEVAEVVGKVVARLGDRVRIGGHFHQDAGCAVANSMVAVAAGATHIQGAANGYGERCGNADLFAIIGALELKEGHKVLPPGRLAALTSTAHAVAELANFLPDARQPYVGTSAFATKAGLHASAIVRRPDAYSHIDPVAVGNRMQVLVSELAGRSNVMAKAGELGLDIEADAGLGERVLERVKELEHRGYAFEAADASFELLVRREAGQKVEPFTLEGYRVLVERAADGSDLSEATVRLHVGGRRLVAVGEGVGPVHALDQALRRALLDDYPQLEALRLVDYKVRILDGRAGTKAVTRVLITSADDDGEWTTIGVSDDVVTASWEALADGYRFGLVRTEPGAVTGPGAEVA